MTRQTKDYLLLAFITLTALLGGVMIGRNYPSQANDEQEIAAGPTHAQATAPDAGTEEGYTATSADETLNADLSVDKKSIGLFDKEGKPLPVKWDQGSLASHGTITDAEFSPNGSRLLVLYSDGYTHLWNSAADYRNGLDWAKGWSVYLPQGDDASTVSTITEYKDDKEGDTVYSVVGLSSGDLDVTLILSETFTEGVGYSLTATKVEDTPASTLPNGGEGDPGPPVDEKPAPATTKPAPIKKGTKA